MTATMFPTKNTNKAANVKRFRSIFAVKTDKIGAEWQML